MHTCREQHEALRILLELLPRSTPFNSGDVVGLLGRLGHLLTTHLKLEDDRLYPALEKSSDRDVRETAHRYRAEMGDLREKFGTFLKTWTAPAISADQQAFMAQWSDLRNALEVRMAKEDDGLYAIAEDFLSRDEMPKAQ
ncbi:MAG: hemerythrin domain-containing protein [Candidatus Eremiobacteraeota bacterium]|nr:hemerythrin domain-containing protein [Candidatus Eremiobacteraeota bacterium]